jgi:hypothetical protein
LALNVDMCCIILVLIPALILCFVFDLIFVIGFFLLFLCFMITWPCAVCCNCESAPPSMYEYRWVVTRPGQTIFRWQQDAHQYVMNEPLQVVVEPQAAPPQVPAQPLAASASKPKDAHPHIDVQNAA